MISLNFPLLFSTFFYIGKVRYAPGTVASLVTLIIWLYLIPEDFLFRLIFVLLLAIAGFLSTKKSLSFFKEKDPQVIVIDEVVGMSISVLFITDASIMVLAFFLFRILDIFKPSIIYYSQNYEGVQGIMIDDIIAGICVLILLINYI